jgi:hypothetical protein
MSLPRGTARFVVASAALLIGCAGDAPLAPEPAALTPTAVVAALTVAPSGLIATAVSGAAVKLDWKDNATNEAGYEVWRSQTGQAGTYTLRTTVAANLKTWKDTGLTPEKQYCYKVRATSAGGDPPSAFSAGACATTWLKPPLNLVATSSSATVITLGWADKTTNEVGYEIWRSTTGSGGTYSALKTVPANTVGADDIGLTAGLQYCYQVRALGVAPFTSSTFSNRICATPAAVALVVRIVLFGDSNTDRCEEMPAPSRISSYVSVSPRLGPTDPHLACSVAGKTQSAWQGVRSETIRVVNHGIASSTSGGGGFGGPNRTSKGSPNARLKVGGFTRYEGEVLGRAYPWSGGEPTNSAFPTGPVKRVNAFTPGPNDFVYVSMGTNDDAGPTRTMPATQTVANLRWMIEQWLAAGRAADHFLLTTLAPRDDANSPTSIPDRNTLIRALAAETGVHLVDLAALTSDDDGATWRSPSLNIGDGIHYTEAVRTLLGQEVVAWLSAKAPAGP